MNKDFIDDDAGSIFDDFRRKNSLNKSENDGEMMQVNLSITKPSLVDEADADEVQKHKLTMPPRTPKLKIVHLP